MKKNMHKQKSQRNHQTNKQDNALQKYTSYIYIYKPLEFACPKSRIPSRRKCSPFILFFNKRPSCRWLFYYVFCFQLYDIWSKRYVRNAYQMFHKTLTIPLLNDHILIKSKTNTRSTRELTYK